MLEKLNGKAIPVIVTSVGGVVIAIYLINALVGTISSNIMSVEGAVRDHNNDAQEYLGQLNTTLKELNQSVQDQTQATRDLQILIRQR